MKTLSTLVALLFVLTACASAPQAPMGGYAAYCKTHATKVTLNQSPDVEGAYQDCLHREGMHEIEVTKTE